MHSGLLWFDNSKKELALKINDAARRYQEKYGMLPDTCFVNPNDNQGKGMVKGIDSIEILAHIIKVKEKSTIMPNHVWLGMAR